MNSKHYMTNDEVFQRARRIADSIKGLCAPPYLLYGVRRGGIPAAYAVLSALTHLTDEVAIVESREEATIFIDDIIDSGATASNYADLYPGRRFFALVNKMRTGDRDLGWVVFPWEGNDESSIENNVTRLIQYIGENPERGGLIETPRRVARAWKDYTTGYAQNPADVLKVFEDGGERYDEMVLVRDLPFYSHCEHHLAPFFGTAHIAYIPNGRIVGLSKLSRLLDVFAKRLQVQERLTGQIVDALMEHLKPRGAAVSITARHLCMEARGVHKQGHTTVTTALRGVMYEDARARSEFMEAIK